MIDEYDRYNSNSLRGMRVRSLGSYGSELIVENFRERFFHICTIATYKDVQVFSMHATNVILL